MSAINLLPLHHRQELYGRRLVKRWTVACVLIAGTLGTGGLAMHQAYSVDDRSLRLDIDQLNEQLAQVDKAHHGTTGQLAHVEADAGLHELVNAPPDFAALLGAISKSCGNDAVLTSLKWDLTAQPQVAAGPVDPAAVKVAVDPLSGPQRLKVEITGVARLQEGIGAVAERLEDTRIFDDVRLVKTSHEGFMAGDALSFQISCEVEPHAGAVAAGGAP